MNDRSDIDRVLGHWFEDGPAAMPDRVVDVVARRIKLRPQRRSWRLLWRSPMSPALKYGAAAAAVLVIALVGYNLLPRLGVGGPGPTPTASPAPTRAPSPGASVAPTTSAATGGPQSACDEAGATCAGKLTAGVVSSNAFQPKLTFTVPAGWNNTLDTNRKYTLRYNFAPSHFLQVITQIAIPEQTADCSRAAKAGAGSGVADWVAFLTTNPGLVTTKPAAITVGGYAGMQLDLHVASSWTATCPNSLGPAVVLWVASSPENQGSRWIDDQQVTVRILDVAGETVIIYLESSSNPADLAALNQQFEAMFATIQFTPRG